MASIATLLTSGCISYVIYCSWQYLKTRLSELDKISKCVVVAPLPLTTYFLNLMEGDCRLTQLIGTYDEICKSLVVTNYR